MAYDAQLPTDLGLAKGNADPMHLLREIGKGLPVRAVEGLSHRVCPDDVNFRYRLVPKATLARRKEAKPARLSSDESEKLVRVASVWRIAERVWGGADGARRFLFGPHPLLEGRSPMDVTLDSELGAKVVEDVLGRLEYGTAV